MWIEREYNCRTIKRPEMGQIDAIYRHGVFEPLEPVDLKEEQRVRLSVEPVGKEAWEAWTNALTSTAKRS
jgi:predicted DNA-binding antitoxin AbrB/MazE fold protein